MTAPATKPPLAGVTRVIPWDAMTDRERENHLADGHGWANRAALGYWHEHDHNRGPAGTWAPHTHDKAPR